MRQHAVDVSRILGPERPLQADRLLGSSPIDDHKAPDGSIVQSTVNRVLRHSEKGCCDAHDRLRKAKAVRLDG